MGAALRDRAPVEDDDLVHLRQARQPVRDEQGGAAFGKSEQVGGQRVRRRGIEVLAGLVEHQDREVGQQGAGDGDPLALSARQACAPGPTAVARPSGRPASHGRTRRAEDVTSSSSVAARRPTRRFSASVVSKR